MTHRRYTLEEDLRIIHYIVETKDTSSIGGDKFWKHFEQNDEVSSTSELRGR